MDAYAVALFFTDLLAIYVALQNGTDLPKPLASFEKGLQYDLSLVENKAKYERDKEFFREWFVKDGPTCYAAPYGGERLMRQRVKKKDPNIKALADNILFNSRSENIALEVGAERSAKIAKFCTDNNLNLQTLVYLALRTYVSKINYNAPDVYFTATFNRRVTLADKRSGGCRVHALPIRTIIGEDKTFMQALANIGDLTMQALRHADFPTLAITGLLREIEGRSPLYTTNSMLLTCLPLQFDPPAEGWECELGGVSSGHFAMALYTFVLTDLSGKNISFHFEHNLKWLSAQKIKAMFDGAMKVLDAGMDNPDITIGALLNDVLREYAPTPLEQITGQKPVGM